MKVEINGDALKLLEDFIKYAKLDPEAMAEAMWYNIDGFNERLRLLEKAVKGEKE